MRLDQVHDLHLIIKPSQFVSWVPEDFCGGDTSRANGNLFDKRQMIGKADLCAAARVVITDADRPYRQP